MTSSATCLRQSFGTFDQWMFDDTVGVMIAGHFDERPLRWPISWSVSIVMSQFDPL